MTLSPFVTKPIKALAIAGLCAGAAAFAGQSGLVYLGVGPNYGGSNTLQDGDGGAFTAVLFSSITKTGNTYTVTPTPVPSGYAASALGSIAHGQISGYSSPGGDGGSATDVGDNPFVGDPGFETFCIENNVDFYVGNYYDYTIGLSVQQSGLSANGHTISSLTYGAAWLYEQYATGAIKLTTTAETGQFQEALWYLQGQPNDSNVGDFSPSNTYYLDVLGKMSATIAQTGITGSDPYGVQVLELTGPAGSPNGTGAIAQDQLIYTGVPDTAATVMLFAFGLGALACLRQRRSRAV
jgi:hypothetical protein